jgi:hypothetical protein
MSGEMPNSYEVVSYARAFGSSVDVHGLETTAGEFAIRIFVTGFGKFRGVPENPTTILAERLDAYITKTNPLPEELRRNILSITYKVLETSADGALEALQKERDLQVCA